MDIQPIQTPNAPVPAGHYAQAVVHHGLVYVAGQLPIDPATGARELGPVGDQATRAIANVAAILEAAGSGLDRVLSLTVFVADIEGWPEINRVLAAAFGAHRPARAVVPTPPLHYGFQVEIQAIAAVRA